MSRYARSTATTPGIFFKAGIFPSDVFPLIAPMASITVGLSSPAWVSLDATSASFGTWASSTEMTTSTRFPFDMALPSR